MSATKSTPTPLHLEHACRLGLRASSRSCAIDFDFSFSKVPRNHTDFAAFFGAADAAAGGPARRGAEAQLTSRYGSPRKVRRWKGSAIVSTPTYKPGGDEYACADDDHIDD